VGKEIKGNEKRQIGRTRQINTQRERGECKRNKTERGESVKGTRRV
jgi:hypothetical protein